MRRERDKWIFNEFPSDTISALFCSQLALDIHSSCLLAGVRLFVL